ncbi:hypothetical protein SAMN02745163_01729 [Clostridium cavendishii DSM 21758]|uniref:Uncharacterized protein n=1 Tax=Clostridium cavendishii DSM 21758 TaxID=1121302 RepID=A0A1M6I8K1_9CLOT|nr:hypothetical protein [Clostridium cavendishii]SHJ30762.1 hypothetical protein SAMN02745163_01729 [Clostridium cavendishii DSM 21758]
MKKKVAKKDSKEIELEKAKLLELEIEKIILTDLQETEELDISRYIPKYPNDLVMNILHSLQKDKGCIENIKFATAGGKITIYDNKAKITFRGERYLNTL